ncbi:MAG TPA: flagellin [Exilispira sp.]|nr:flagellin [Exilispira sp.]HQM88933.1 flagellin [Exilispira sp.]HQQ19574.1 flagellin [Exilispira sp.]
MIINHNMSAQFANRLLKSQLGMLGKSIEKISSGERINNAGDDASGLAVSEKLRSQIRGLKQAEKNVQNGISFLQTAEGSLQEVHSILHRIRELAIQAANGIYSMDDRMLVQIEVGQLVDEIDRIATSTEFNKFKILDGTLQSVRLHVGPNADQFITLKMSTMTSRALGVNGVSLSTPDSANVAIAKVDAAVNNLSSQRASLGATQNRLMHTAASVSQAAESLQSAESLIRDTDMSTEIVELTKNQVLVQSSTAVLAQANLIPNLVLELLR